MRFYTTMVTCEWPFIYMWTLYFCACAPTQWRTRFFIWNKFIYLFLENDLESPLIFVLFLKGKQNKKENPKCASLFGKDGLWKTKSRLEGQVTY